MSRGSWQHATSLALAMLAVAVAALAAHSRFTVEKPVRTVLSGNTFEDTRNKTGSRLVW
jgi:cytochrome b